MAKLPILMYHNVSLTESEGLTISAENLDQQLNYLSSKKYQSYHIRELSTMDQLEGSRNIVITFDDAYVNQFKIAVPLLKKYELKATFFVPLAYLGKTDEWNTGALEIMDAAYLHDLPNNLIELGYHSFAHKKYDEMSQEEIIDDTKKCLEIVSENKLIFSPGLAYPYGKYPRKGVKIEDFKNSLRKSDVEYGFRIGNRLNSFPFKKPFEIQRLDIKGEYSLEKFKRKIKYGKLF